MPRPKPVALTPRQQKLYDAIKRAADEKGRVQLDRNVLAQLSGLKPSEIATERKVLIDRGYLYKIGNSVPVRVRVLQ